MRKLPHHNGNRLSDTNPAQSFPHPLQNSPTAEPDDRFWISAPSQIVDVATAAPSWFPEEAKSGITHPLYLKRTQIDPIAWALTSRPATARPINFPPQPCPAFQGLPQWLISQILAAFANEAIYDIM